MGQVGRLPEGAGPFHWAIHAAVEHIEDPLFGKHPESRYVALHRQIARHAPTSAGGV